VDSELLAQLANRHAGETGINLAALCEDLRHLEGRMSAVMVSRTHPGTIILLKGNMPLEVRWHPRLKIWAYASESTILTRALAGRRGWEPVLVPMNHALVISVRSEYQSTLVPFTFNGSGGIMPFQRQASAAHDRQSVICQPRF